MLPRELRQYSNYKVFLALGAIIAVAVLTTAVTLVAISQLVNVRQTAQTNNNAKSQLQLLQLHLRTAESRQRAFLLSGTSEYLDRYNDSRRQVGDDLTAVEQLSQGLPYQAEVAKIRPDVDAKLRYMSDTIAAKQSSQDSTDSNTVLEQGQQVMDRIDANIQKISATQTTLINHDRVKIEGLANLARDISLGTLLLTLVLAAVIYYLYLRAIQSERRLDRAKDEFVSLASHQLRTPATGIKSILSTMLAEDFGPLTDRQNYFLRKALQSNERELRIIEELLNVAKADAGRMVLRPVSVDLRHLVDIIVAEQRPVIEAKHLTIQVKQTGEPITLAADEEKLYMTISNLIDNARKYTPAGGKITVRLYSKGKRGACIEVADTGHGIAESEIAHIFDRFQRANSVLSGFVEGTGLGLYLARRIVELHNGSIEVVSKLEHGTRFTITIPFRKLDAAKDSPR